MKSEGMVLIIVVATVGGARQTRPGLAISAQHSEQDTLCLPSTTDFPKNKSKYCPLPLIRDTANDNEILNVTENEGSQKAIQVIAWPTT